MKDLNRLRDEPGADPLEVSLVQLARSEGYEVMEAPAAEVALHIFEKEKVDLAILDLNLTSGGSGLDLLRKMRELDPEVMGIIVTAYASVESAVEASRLPRDASDAFARCDSARSRSPASNSRRPR